MAHTHSSPSHLMKETQAQSRDRLVQSHRQGLTGSYKAWALTPLGLLPM